MSDLVKIKYVGPHVDGVDFIDPSSGVEIHFPQGEPIEVAHGFAYGAEEQVMGDTGPVYDDAGKPVMRKARAGLLEPELAGAEDAPFRLVVEEKKRSRASEEEV